METLSKESALFAARVGSKSNVKLGQMRSTVPTGCVSSSERGLEPAA